MKRIAIKVRTECANKLTTAGLLVLLMLSHQFTFKRSWAQETLTSSEILTTDIRSHQPAEAITILVAGNDEITVRRQSASVPLTRGAAIIIADAQAGLFGTKGVSAMTKQLNQWGWLTLVVPAPILTLSSTIPDENDAAINARSSSHQITSEAVLRYSLALTQRLEAAYASVQTTPGYRLVVSHGINAAGLIRLYSLGSIVPPDGLVVSGPFWPQDSLNQELPTQLAQTPFAVLDVTNEWDNRWSQKTQENRKIMATTELKMHYRQRELVGPAYNFQQYQYMAKEIYGWFSYLGW